MKPLIQLVSREEYNKIGSVLFENSYSRCFAKLVVGDNTYTLAWHSDLLLPKVISIPPKFIAIGIDQKFSVLDCNSADTVLNLSLDYNFSKVEVFQNSLFIATELEIIEVQTADWKIVSRIILPSFFEEFININKFLKVRCIDGEVIDLPTKV
jgi:hypothetical protein